MVMVRGGGKELGVLLEAGQTLHYDLHVIEDCVDGVIHVEGNGVFQHGVIDGIEHGMGHGIGHGIVLVHGTGHGRGHRVGHGIECEE